MGQLSRKLKIGITCYPALGGSGVVATELGKLLAEEGHEVHFIASSIPFRLGRYYPNIYFHKVAVNQYSVFRYPPYDLTLANKMAQVAKRESLDILHVHYAIPHAICAYLAKQMTDYPLKVVTTLHGTDITVLGYDETLKDMIKFGIDQSDAVTAVSQNLIDETHRLFDVSKPIEKVYNFVDMRHYKHDRQTSRKFREYHLCSEDKLIVHISNFRPVKRVDDVARIFQLISKRVPAKLVLIGDGPEWPKVRKWLKENDLDQQTIFLGEQENVPEILTQADLMLLPSEKESFGLVALEAMACGIPVIATDTGGLPEVIIHGQTGYVYPIGQVEQMADAAVHLLLDEELYASFSEASVTRAKEHFAATDILEQYVQIYERVLQS